MSSSNNYHPMFDYVRFLLASVVMLAHEGYSFWWYQGKLAVDVFFVMSGWLVGGILLRTTIKDLPVFFFNRAMRIWIPYFIGVALIVCASLLKEPITEKWIEFIIYKLTWVYNHFGPPQLEEYSNMMPLDGTGNHFWSVNTEEQFYLLAPLLLVIFASFGRKIATWIGLFALFYLLGVFFKIYGLASISLGVLCAVLNNRVDQFYEKKPVKIFLLGLAFVSVLGFVFVDNYHAFAPLFSIAVLLLIAKKGKQTSSGYLLGGLSYPLYLNHWIGIFIGNALAKQFAGFDSFFDLVVANIINYVFAGMLFWYIERKVLNSRKKIYSLFLAQILSILAYATILIGLAYATVKFGGILSIALLALFSFSALIAILYVYRPKLGQKTKAVEV